MINSNLRRCQTNDKIGRFYLPTKSPYKNLSCVMQKSPNFVNRQNRWRLNMLCLGQQNWAIFAWHTTDFYQVILSADNNGRFCHSSDIPLCWSVQLSVYLVLCEFTFHLLTYFFSLLLIHSYDKCTLHTPVAASITVVFVLFCRFSNSSSCYY